MFSFPPEFPFVSGRKADMKPKSAPPAADPVAEETETAPSVQKAASQQPVHEEPELLTAPQPPMAKAPAPVAPTAPFRKPAPAAPAETPRPERRKIKRDALAASALLRIDGHHGPPSKIELTDITIAGARFRCPHPMEVGEKAQVRLEVGPFRWTTRLRIVHCTRVDENSVSIGCAFLRTELLRPWPAAA